MNTVINNKITNYYRSLELAFVCSKQICGKVRNSTNKVLEQIIRVNDDESIKLHNRCIFIVVSLNLIKIDTKTGTFCVNGILVYHKNAICFYFVSLLAMTLAFVML